MKIKKNDVKKHQSTKKHSTRQVNHKLNFHPFRARRAPVRMGWRGGGFVVGGK